MIRRRVLALATATALTLTPVSVASAQETLGDLSAAVGSNSQQLERTSSQLRNNEVSSNDNTNRGDNSSVLELTGNPTTDVLLDLVIAIGVWAIFGSIYGQFIAPNLPRFSLIGLLPS